MSWRKIVFLSSALVLLLMTVTWSVASITSLPSDTYPNESSVILVSWDGVQREHFYELLRRGALPNIQTLSAEGSLVNITVTDHATDTKAGHSEMLTGYGPSITGVFSNRAFQPIPVGYTIFERAELSFGASGVATFMVTGKTHNLGGEEGEPFYNARSVLDVFDSNDAGAKVVGSKAIKYLNDYSKSPFLAFIHFSDPDSMGHKYGENSINYERAIVSCDRWLGRIVETLKRNQVYESTGIVVTSDHGFDEGATSHRKASYVFAASNRHLLGNGDQRAIAPTVLSLMGISLEQFKPQLLPPLTGIQIGQEDYAVVGALDRLCQTRLEHSIAASLMLGVRNSPLK